ncbi:MAG: cystathionine beta-synthase [Planctomycetota bacterium]|nr:MAG: cystathionine beta-synthase [Planctomycetota bacterium]
MQILDSILDYIGNTPLVRLRRIPQSLGIRCTLAAKVEYCNPGGSVKDRPALKMLEEAERAGLLKPGGTIVEPTSGNTGAALAMAAAIKGYRCILVMPDKMAPEKFALLRAYGAETVTVPTVGANNPESYYNVANRLTAEIPGAFQPNQFENPNNPQAHYETTGPEIWRQTDGKIDYFVAGIGTGGTITGTSRFLKEKNPNIKVIGADPEGSIYTPGSMPKAYKVEGIGEDFVPRTVDLKLVDKVVNVSDKDSFLMARRLSREEGLLVGGSCGTAMCAALTIASELPAEKLVVVLLPDTGRGYLSKIYNDDWMQQFGFLAPPGQGTTLGDVLAAKGETPALITVSPKDSVRKAIDLMRRNGISQVPVADENGVIVGAIQEVTAMQLVFDHVDIAHKHVGEVMGSPFPKMDKSTEIEKGFKALSLGATAIIVRDGNKPIGLLTKSDFIAYLSGDMENESAAVN